MDYKQIYEKDTETQEIVDSINSPEDLINKYYNQKFGNPKTIIQRRNFKMQHAWKAIQLNGHGLELAFGLGTSIYWLCKRFPDITLSGIDFADHYRPMLKHLRGLFPARIGGIWINSVENMNWIAGNYYDFINSSSVFEHLPDHVYFKTIDECYRVLKPGGLMGVYVDQSKCLQHIRIVKPKQTRKELVKIAPPLPIGKYFFP